MLQTRKPTRYFADPESVVFTVKGDAPSAEMRGASKITERIKAAPSVDAIVVCRCKDCRFRKSTFNGLDYFCTVWDADESETAYVTEYDFCSYGERKDGADG